MYLGFACTHPGPYQIQILLNRVVHEVCCSIHLGVQSFVIRPAARGKLVTRLCLAARVSLHVVLGLACIFVAVAP